MPIRLNGLAAPESNEPGGNQATAAMKKLVLDREVRCELDGERTHDRWSRFVTWTGSTSLR
jgi:micrococcal nuclease